jgi:hypothetical protein
MKKYLYKINNTVIGNNFYYVFNVHNCTFNLMHQLKTHAFIHTSSTLNSSKFNFTPSSLHSNDFNYITGENEGGLNKIVYLKQFAKENPKIK